MREQQREIPQQRYERLWIIGLRGHVDSACQQRRSLLFIRGGTQLLGEECLLQLAELSLKIWHRSLVWLPKARPARSRRSGVRASALIHAKVVASTASACVQLSLHTISGIGSGRFVGATQQR